MGGKWGTGIKIEDGLILASSMDEDKMEKAPESTSPPPCPPSFLRLPRVLTIAHTAAAAVVVAAAAYHGHAETHHQHSLGILHSIVMLLAHSPHDGILLTLLHPWSPSPRVALRHQDNSTAAVCPLIALASPRTMR